MGHVLYEVRVSSKMGCSYFQVEELSENEGCPKFLDWEDFRNKFKKECTVGVPGIL